MGSQAPSRREFLRGTFFTALGAVLGALVTSSCQKLTPGADSSKQGKQATPSLQGVRPSTALSLSVLQEEAEKRRQALPDELAHLGGMNQIQGFMIEPDGELLLLGNRDPSFPPIDLEELVVALRNAYQVSSAYQGAPGCSIDPLPGSKDPWRVQEVKVFGMPAKVAMAARHVALDFELKKVSAGILSLGDGVSSLYELARSASPLCEGPLDKEQKAETTHRFWFYPLYPSPPRFMEEEGIVLILKPIEVQLLTEQEFFDKTGKRNSSAPPSPLAENFAQFITQLLAENSHYAQLRNDFRVIEVGQLLRFKQVPAENLRYFLQDYPLKEVTVPAFVGGIRREERGEVVCESQITERQVPEGRFIESREQVQRYHFTSRGGVEARVDLTPDHFVEERSGALAYLRRRVRASQPSARSLLWPIEY